MRRNGAAVVRHPGHVDSVDHEALEDRVRCHPARDCDWDRPKAIDLTRLAGLGPLAFMRGLAHVDDDHLQRARTGGALRTGRDDGLLTQADHRVERDGIGMFRAATRAVGLEDGALHGFERRHHLRRAVQRTADLDTSCAIGEATVTQRPRCTDPFVLIDLGLTGRGRRGDAAIDPRTPAVFAVSSSDGSAFGSAFAAAAIAPAWVGERPPDRNTSDDAGNARNRRAVSDVPLAAPTVVPEIDASHASMSRKLPSPTHAPV